MAKQTNKTNHILNLLSGNGKKKDAGDGKELENAVPPVVPKSKRKDKQEEADSREHVEIETQVVVDVVDEKIEEKENEELVNSINLALEDELKKYEDEKAAKEAILEENLSFENEIDTETEILLKAEVETESLEEAKAEAEALEEIETEEVETEEVETEEVETEEVETEKVETEEVLLEQVEDEKEIDKENQVETLDNLAQKKETSYVILNVMENLVDRFALEYMEKFQICTCDRCLADVKALTLTKLSGKYVIVDKGAEQAMLNYYEKKFKSDIIVELTKACITIDENPHH